MRPASPRATRRGNENHSIFGCGYAAPGLRVLKVPATNIKNSDEPKFYCGVMLRAVLFMPDGKMKNSLKTLAILSALAGMIGTWVILSVCARVCFDGGAARPGWLLYMITGGVLLVTSSLAAGGVWFFHRLGGVLCSRNNAAALGGIGVFLLTMRAFPEEMLTAQLSRYEPFKDGLVLAGPFAGAVGLFIALSSSLVAYKLLLLLINKCLGQTSPRAGEGR
jgi:hypothetical protein